MTDSNALDLTKKTKWTLLDKHQHVNARSARGNFSRLVNTARIQKERVVITEYGEPAAAIVPITDLRMLDDIPNLDWVDDMSEAEFKELRFSDIKALLGKGEKTAKIPEGGWPDDHSTSKTA